MATKTELANLALSHLRQNRSLLSDLDVDTSPIARTVRLFYNTARKKILALHSWNFATNRVALALDGTQDEGDIKDYAYKYVMPSNSVAILAIEPRMQFEVRKGKIYTHKEQAIARYIEDVTDTSLFSIGFENTFTYYLAFILAPTITEDKTLEQMLFNKYQKALLEAKMEDSNEELTTSVNIASWHQVY